VRYYTVGSGDTLYRIARRVYGEGRHWRAVYEANRDLIDDPRELTLGWTLELPPLETVVAEN
jgi:nucleoid-associated protein YgaU